MHEFINQFRLLNNITVAYTRSISNTTIKQIQETTSKFLPSVYGCNKNKKYKQFVYRNYRYQEIKF